MAMLPEPPQLPGAPSDKVQHIAAFLTLALLGSAAYPRLSSLKLLGGLVLFGGAIELVQFVPGRDSELSDWAADIVAAAVGVIAVSLVHRFRDLRRER